MNDIGLRICWTLSYGFWEVCTARLYMYVKTIKFLIPSQNLRLYIQKMLIIEMIQTPYESLYLVIHRIL